MKKLVVLPNDPLYRYKEKGEIKVRYFNPGNYFDEVHVISLCQKDSTPDEVQTVAGTAKLSIHTLARPSWASLFSLRRKVYERIKEIRPHCIRAYNPLLMGWYAVYAGEALGIPTVLSLHDDYSIWRRRKTYGPGYMVRAAYQLAYRLSYERYTLSHVDRIICAYAFVKRYVEHFRKKGIDVIYNRVDLNRFHPRNAVPLAKQAGEPIPSEALKVLCVGRQFQGKDPTAMLKALQHLKVTLTLIGNGPLQPSLKRLAEQLHLQQQVKFLDAVPNERLPEYYANHDIFAMAMVQPGVCIPVLEAMASGLPIVINKPLWGEQPEVVEELAMLVENTPEGYRQAFQTLLEQPALREQLGRQVRARALQYDGAIMEEKEKNVYETLLTTSGS